MELNAAYIGITIAVIILLGAIYASLKYIAKEKAQMAASDKVEFKESDIIEENLRKIDEIKAQQAAPDSTFSPDAIYEELKMSTATSHTYVPPSPYMGNDGWNTEPAPLINEVEIKPTNFGNLS